MHSEESFVLVTISKLDEIIQPFLSLTICLILRIVNEYGGSNVYP